MALGRKESFYHSSKIPKPPASAQGLGDSRFVNWLEQDEDNVS